MLRTRLPDLGRMFLVSLIGLASANGQHNVSGLMPRVQKANSVAGAAESYGRLPLTFEVNQGQTDSHVKFLAQGPGYTLFLTSNEALLALLDIPRAKDNALCDQVNKLPISSGYLPEMAAYLSLAPENLKMQAAELLVAEREAMAE